MNELTILVVDDEDYIRDSVQIILETEEYKVLTARNGVEALKILETTYVDIVLSDIKMPEMDGVTLLKKIKEKYKNIEVLLITGYPSLDTAVESVKIGANDYITKPFKIDDLINKIKKAYESKKLKQEVVELKQLISIYDSSRFFSITLDHGEILNKFDEILEKNFALGGYFVKLFTKSLEHKKNLILPLENFIKFECTFKKSVILFKEANEEVVQMKFDGQDISIYKQPMYTNDGLWGIFFAYKKGSDSFSDIDIKMLSIYVSQFSIALQNSFSYEDVSKGYFETISSLSKAVDAKDHYTSGHSENVKDYSLMIVDEMGLGNEFREKIMYAGLLHDIGKIGVRTEIIVKPDKLTNEEYEEMKKHPIYGKDILEPIEFLGDVPYYVLYHHEKLDGTGYPFGLIASEIPFGAKILQVADSYDAMTTDRSYRKKRNSKLAIEELERCSGTQFDEKIVEAFKNALKKKGKL
jgi:response regulator RpfG family c-di-GMP phosphodiesterase